MEYIVCCVVGTFNQHMAMILFCHIKNTFVIAKDEFQKKLLIFASFFLSVESIKSKKSKNEKLLHLQWHCCVQSSRWQMYDNEQKILQFTKIRFPCIFLSLFLLQWISKCEFPWHLKEYQKIIFIYFLFAQKSILPKIKLKFYKLVGKFDFSPNAHTNPNNTKNGNFSVFFFSHRKKTFPLKYLLLCLFFPLLPEDTKYLIWEQKISAKVFFSFW